TKAHEGTEQGRHPSGCGQAMLPSDTRIFRSRLVVSHEAELDSQESSDFDRGYVRAAVWFGSLSMLSFPWPVRTGTRSGKSTRFCVQSHCSGSKSRTKAGVAAGRKGWREGMFWG